MSGLNLLNVLVVVVTLTPRVLASPSCHDPSGTDYEHYRCFNFSSPDDFSRLLERPQLHKDLHFVLKDSSLSHLPEGAFSQINASVLELNNVQLDVFNLEDENPLDGLQTSLRRLILGYGSTIPTSWAPFSTLEKLTTNLEVVGIRHCNLKVFQRSMLPRPAPKLWRLDLFKNELSSLPADFSADMPALRSVTVEHNQIKTFEEQTFAPLTNNDTNRVRFLGNPLHCDCKLRFVLSYPPSWLNAICETPEALQNQSLKTLTAEQLTCADGA
ncbi:hypothetical protein HPB48_004354 [Haemaphysalis longicornis]|uniref:Secreted protein n=1 Tax=Haemaphysalis longicornis TaxID=44386 RepID=A0A9J6G1J8_HAELO|nr:hypothetical protein HPB48_004354 [Haemaphysalis longicornis]